jgi:hypothetical protein
MIQQPLLLLLLLSPAQVYEKLQCTDATNHN